MLKANGEGIGKYNWRSILDNGANKGLVLEGLGQEAESGQKALFRETLKGW